MCERLEKTVQTGFEKEFPIEMKRAAVSAIF